MLSTPFPQTVLVLIILMQGTPQPNAPSYSPQTHPPVSREQQLRQGVPPT